MKDDKCESELKLQEMRHRMKNTIQVMIAILRLQLRNATGREAQTRLRSALQAISAIAKVHDSIDGSGRADIGRHVRQVTRLWCAIGATQDVDIEADCDGGLATREGETLYLAMIVNELLTNCLEHAFPHGNGGAVQVELRRDGAQAAQLVVRDDGVGPGNWPEEGASGGTAIIRGLVSGLQGEIEVQPGARGGTEVRVTFPLD